MSDNIKWRPIKTAPYNTPLIVTFNLIHTYTAYKSDVEGEKDLWFEPSGSGWQTPDPTHWTPLPTKKGLKITKKKQEKRRQEQEKKERENKLKALGYTGPFHFDAPPKDAEYEEHVIDADAFPRESTYRIGNQYLVGKDAEDAHYLTKDITLETFDLQGRPYPPESLLKEMHEFWEREKQPHPASACHDELLKMCRRNNVMRARRAVLERELLMRAQKRKAL